MPARPRKTTNARKAEALTLGASVTFGGHTYTVAPYREWDIDALEAIDDQQYVRALKGVLGDAQWAEFRRRHSKIGELEDFLSLVMEASGQGNS